jgi:hypothetical protein
MLNGINGLQPSGSYKVETDEEVLETVLLPAYRRISTSIRLPARRGRIESPRIFAIDPVELAMIQAHDAQEHEQVLSPAFSRSSHIRKEGEGALMASAPNAWKRWVALNANDLAWTALVVGAVLVAGLISR